MQNFVYPIREKVEESWERLLKIYDIADKLVGSDYIVPVSTCDIMQAWYDMAVFLANAIELLNGVDYMYEAIYHIRYRVFTENVNESDELMLVLLIEEELCRCGYAFYMWSNMSEFQSRYYELLFPRKNGRGWRAFCPWYMEMYLAGNMANRILLKNIKPIDWGEELDCDSVTYPYGPDYLRYRVTVFEQAMEILLPESNGWYEEWMDIEYITGRIKARYKMDFRNDKKGFDNLIGLTVERKFPKICAYYIYRLNNITPELLEVLWGENTQNMMQKCFLNIFQRYMAAKKAGTKRSRYSCQAVQQSALYRWLEQHTVTEEQKPRRPIKRAMFQIGLNI